MTRTTLLAIVAMLGGSLLAGCGSSSNSSGGGGSGGIGTGSGAASTPTGRAFYFAATDGIYGTELYRTDGVIGGTTLRVKDINPGAGDSNPSGFFEFPAGSGTWYFAADDGKNGSELWKTDGSEAGTVLVADINTTLVGSGPATAGSYPQGFVIFKNALYFRAGDGTHGQELWRTDGTPCSDINNCPGTYMVADINPGVGSSLPYELTVFNNLLIFRADDGTDGWELWKSDGVQCPAATPPAPPPACPGTTMIANIYPDTPGAPPNGSQPNGFLAISPTQLLFNADDGTHGQELWSTDGTTASMVMDINPGGSSSAPFDLTLFNGAVYFQANDGTHGIELWKTDGTAVGTQLVVDINVGAASANPYGLTTFDNGSGPALYFRATTAASGTELWKSDGAPCASITSTSCGTVIVADINAGAADSNPYEFAILNGKLYFAATDTTYGRELWVSDGVPCAVPATPTPPCGTVLLKDINTFGNSSPQGLQVFDNGTTKHLLMTATDGTDGRELWSSDGTAAGTGMVLDILFGAGDGVPNI